ncbi:MAG: hypothetical protein ABIQ31_18595 [Ferruginibacter sp.]
MTNSQLVQLADELIPKADGQIHFKKNGETGDIIAEVIAAFRDSREQLRQFAPHLKADTLQQTLYNVWHFWKANVQYKVDPANVQWVQEPKAFWHPPDRSGDCKSFSIAVMSSLYCLGIKAAFRFASYNGNKDFPTHVYVVALVNGKEIPVDCVWKEFGTEKPFTKNWDYNMTAINRLSGLANTGDEIGKFRLGKFLKKIANPLNSIKLLKKVQPHNLIKAAKKKKKSKRGRIRGVLDMPLDNPHITGEVADLLLDKQYLEMQQIQHAKIHGIGTTYDNAFETQIIAHHNALASIMGWPERKFVDVDHPVDPSLRENIGFLGMGKKAKAKKTEKAKTANAAGKAVSKKQAKLLAKAGITATKIKAGLFKRIANGLKKVLTTPARLALKAVLPKNAPFFLYLFITDPKVLAKLPDQVNIKRQKAIKYKGIIVDKLQMPESNFEKTIRNGIMNAFGKSPEEVLGEWMKTANFSVGFIDTVLKLAGSGLKMLLGKAAGNLQEDVANFTPAPEDWGILTAEQQQQMSAAVQNQPGNPIPQTMDQLNQSTGGGSYGGGGYGSSYADGDSDDSGESTRFKNRGNNTDDATGETNLNNVQNNDEAVVRSDGKKDNTMMYLGIAAVAAIALVGGKKKRA